MLEKYNSRKFILASVGLVASIVLVSVGIMPPDTWVGAVSLILGFYFTANVTQKATTNG